MWVAIFPLSEAPTMKLYFAPDTCSLSPHIVLQELGMPYELPPCQ